MQKPELLIPAGSPEALMAAIEGGADAVYLGLQSFNARNRAKNFNINELPDVLALAKKHRIKVYITLNTLLKNNELPKLIRLLSSLSRLPISALIIQDWGVYWLIKKFFPKIPLHTSTQMGNHNSLDCLFAQQKGFERAILARELSFSELKQIRAKVSIEMEIFVHGALCYSYSGYCLFSSWIGGNSANRGSCRQPCRQLFQSSSGNGRPFCMKDLQLIDHLPEIAEAGICSLKIEGRMRSAEYVYKVASAYRMALDSSNRIPEAKTILSEDGGRAKTKWRFSGDNVHVICSLAQTGTEIGTVCKATTQYIFISLYKPLEYNHTLQIMLDEPQEPITIKLNRIYLDTDAKLQSVKLCVAGQTAVVEHVGVNIPIGTPVIRLARSNAKQFQWTPSSTKLPAPNLKQEESILKQIYSSLSPSGTRSGYSATNSPAKANHSILYIRISDQRWLPLLQNISNLRVICPLACAEAMNRPNLIAELPLYIPEPDLSKVQKQIKNLVQKGYTDFSISRLSHGLFFQHHKQVKLLANEHIYCLNDAAISMLKEHRISHFVSPVENDFPNLLSSKDRSAIIPLYFHPNLFFSLQAPDLEMGIGQHFEQKKLRTSNTNGVYTTTPQDPVCLFNFHQRLVDKGFTKFLIDLSHLQPDSTMLRSIMDSFQYSTRLPHTSGFNFKKGLH